jgi:hypothetical protein
MERVWRSPSITLRPARSPFSAVLLLNCLEAQQQRLHLNRRQPFRKATIERDCADGNRRDSTSTKYCTPIFTGAVPAYFRPLQDAAHFAAWQFQPKAKAAKMGGQSGAHERLAVTLSTQTQPLNGSVKPSLNLNSRNVFPSTIAAVRLAPTLDAGQMPATFGR